MGKAGKLALGVGRRGVTPPMGVALAGYGLKPERTIQTVLDELLVRAVVIDDGAQKIALVSVDICLLNSGFVDTIRARIQRETGIAAGAIMIAATHSHSAPTTQYLRQWGELNPAYVETLGQRITEAVVDAAKNLAPAQFGSAQTRLPGLGTNRVHKDRPIDETLSVLVARSGKDLKLAAAHYGLHPVFMPMDSRFVSAEFPGRLVRDVEAQHSGAQAMFFNGTLGDVNPLGVWKGVDASQDAGRALATATSSLAETVSGKSDGEVAFATVDCDLELDGAYARAEAENYLFGGKIPKGHEFLSQGSFLREWAHEVLGTLSSGSRPLRLQIQAVRVNDTAFVAIPGEPYTLIGEKLKAESPFAHTLVTSCANGSFGYLCEARDYTEQTYGAVMVPKILGYPPFRPDAWEVVSAAALSALRKL